MRMAPYSHILGPCHGHPTLLPLRLFQGKRSRISNRETLLASLAHKCIFQVVQEYERAVIFRLGRLLSGGSRGPGKYYQPLFRSTQVHILKTGCLLLPLILLKEILGGKKTFLFGKKGWRATTIALRFSSFQVLSSYFRASRITQRSTFAPRLLTFPRRRFVLDLLYNSLMQQNSGYILRLLCSSEINSSTSTTLTRKTYEYMADSLLV